MNMKSLWADIQPKGNARASLSGDGETDTYPFSTAGALGMAHQGQFNPLKFLKGAAQGLNILPMGNYFEGFYFKHQIRQDTLSIIVGRAADGAFIQIVTDTHSYHVPYPLKAYLKGEILTLEDNYFSRHGIRLSIQTEGLNLTGEISYSGITPIQGDIMGPFRFLPMQCRHPIVSMNHTLSGKLVLNGRELDFTGGRGYIEGDAGRSFPKSYTWVQCNAFSGGCSIMASVAHIPFGLWWFWGCICVVSLAGKEYRLATYRGATIRHRDERRLLLEQGDFSLSVQLLEPCPGNLLRAPSKGRMTGHIREAPSCRVLFEFRRKNDILFKEESHFASYEHVV
ncbi:MAG TPA: hypothetical protein DC001_02570 [Clostridiales bacterium]|nr:hypothetical protein [Clostridiales bacterium]